MEKVFKSRGLTILLTLIGALSGFLYWRYVGCLSGTCPIRSVWYWSTLWGGVMGFLVGDLINDFIKKQKKKKENIE